MAKASFKMPEEFLKKISRLGDKTDEIVPKVLMAGAKVIRRKTKSNLLGVIGKNTKTPSRSTGTLASSLGVSPVRLNKDGNHDIKIGFGETRSDGVSNALIANTLEYGKSGQPPKPFLKPAKSASKNACVDAMIAAFEKEVENI